MTAEDKTRGGMGEPAVDGEPVTASDTDDLETITRGLWVGGAGTVKCIMFSGRTVEYAGVQAGTLLPFRVKRVLATGTTATLMVGVY